MVGLVIITQNPNLTAQTASLHVTTWRPCHLQFQASRAFSFAACALLLSLTTEANHRFLFPNPFCSSRSSPHWKQGSLSIYRRWSLSNAILWLLCHSELGNQRSVLQEIALEKLFPLSAPVSSPFPQQFPHRVLLSIKLAKPELQQWCFKSFLQRHTANWGPPSHTGNTWPLERKNDLGGSQGGIWAVLVETLLCFPYKEEKADCNLWRVSLVTLQFCYTATALVPRA